MTEDILQRNNIRIKGKGEKPVLFVNGYGCDQSIWRKVWPEFEKDLRIILFDHIGSGESAMDRYDYEKYNELQAYADDIIEICEELSLREVIIVGHSVGCMIAMLAVNKAPEMFSLMIMVSPSPCYINNGDYYGGFSKEDVEEMIDTLESNYLGWANNITPVITGNPEVPEFAEELSNRFCRNNPDIAKHFARVTFLGDNRKDLPEIPIKTLIIQVSQDVIAPMEVGDYMRETIPDNSFRIIEGTGHCPHLTNPEETIQAIREFLKEKENTTLR